MDKSIVESIVSKIKEEKHNYVIFGNNKEMYIDSRSFVIKFDSDYILGVNKNDNHKVYMSYESVTMITEYAPADTKFEVLNHRAVC